MGYESRIYVVQKGAIKNSDGMSWAEDIAMFDLCKMGSDFYNSVHKYPKTDCYIYSDDGNTKILEDVYGDPLIEIPLADLITILEKIKEGGNTYRRIDPILSLLKGFDFDVWGELTCLHYGH